MIEEKYPHLALSLSSEVDPAFREYERTVVTTFDAYVKPVLASYLNRMAKGEDFRGITLDAAEREGLRQSAGMGDQSALVKRGHRLGP